MTSISIPPRPTGLAPRTWWLLAGLAATTSLGLGWDWYYHPYLGTQLLLTPGSSVVLADGTINYIPGVLMVYPTFAFDSGVIPGYASHARVLLAAAVLVFVLAVRRGSQPLARIGLALGVVAPVLSGGLTQGSAIFLAGLACANMALRTTGLLQPSMQVGGNRGMPTSG